MSQPEAPPAPWTPPPGWVPTPQGWVPPRALPRRHRPPLTAGPLPFHRLFRGLPGFRWWRPLVALAVGTAIYLVVSTLFVLVLIIIGVVDGSIDLGTTASSANEALNKLIEIDAASPLKLVLGLGSVALLLPSAILAQLIAGLRPLGVRHSVAFRIRWRWFALTLIPAFVTVIVAFGAPILVTVATGAVPAGPMTTDPALFAVCVGIILVLTPFQAAAEEYVFRGLLLQSIGSWVRFAPIGWVIGTLIFVSGHPYDPWGLISVGIFGLGAAIVVSRSGGLEAGIALHSVNNIAAFVLLASGVQGTTVNPTQASGDVGSNLIGLAVTLVTTAGWVFWVDRMARRRGLATTGSALVQDAVTPAEATVPSARGESAPLDERSSD